jgi:PEP-CTERM motif
MKKYGPICLMLGAVAALAMCSTAIAHPGGVNAPSPDLPPIIPDNEYLSPADVHARYSGPALEIVLSMIEHQPFAGQPPQNFPDREVHHFESQLNGQGACNGPACAMMGIPPVFPVNMSGPVDTVAFNRPPGGLGTFDTEMLSMSLTGGGVMVRESPTRASTGKTSITDIGGGMYHIDSFFDVFTELSLDGGMSWIPSNMGSDGQSHPTRVYLGGIPEPASIALLALGIIGIAGTMRRR